MVTLKNIEEARAKLENIAHLTPIAYSYSLSELSGVSIYLKLENLQRTGSFKIRGAYNKLHNLLGGLNKTAVAASAGNHAQGVALAANLLGMKATIVMPEGTPTGKILATKHYGAEVILQGKTFDDAFSYARELGKESENILIHAFDDPEIIVGQGTVGLEIIEEIPNLDAIFVPIGGGGLISGISTALKEKNPKIKVIGVQAEGAPSMLLSQREGKIIELKSVHTIADGIAVKKVGKVTFDIVQKYVDDIVTVDENEIAEAVLLLMERKKVIAEGAGAASLAGLLKIKEEFLGQKVAVLVSGGNIDVNMLAKIIEKGLVKSGRFIRLEIELPDVPGALGRLASLLGKVKANIVQIYHDRFERDLPLDKTIVEISLETRGYEHIEEILKLLRGNGYSPRQKE